VSPEIVLVSPPEEAERFRASLPPTTVEHEPPGHGLRRILVSAAALVILGAAGYLAATRWPHPPGPTLLTEALTTQAVAPRTSPTVTLTTVETPETRAVSARPVTGTLSVTTASAPPRVVPTVANHPAFVPARRWVWSEVKGVTAYEVDFYRNGRRVFHALVHEPRVEMPRTFRFEAGRYRWTVVQAAPTRSTSRVVDSRFELSAAAAGAANAAQR
jgi:hypothetical protein